MLPAFAYNSQSMEEISCSESSQSANKRKSLADYDILPGKELGRGSYGKVSMVREKATGKLFAMKEMSKAFFKEHGCVENLIREIKIHRKLKHPHITQLLHYFEDQNNVYLILQYAENGSLFKYVQRRKRLSEQEAFIYFLHTCLGIDYLHKKSIIHRDLKPENLLLDEKGNVKVCDFGWSAENITGDRTTFCGTLEYMAPEIIRHKPYTKSVDIWSLGILLFELMHGRSPFEGKELEIKKKILSGAQPIFDPIISEEARDLVRSILVSDPFKRLTMEEIFNHRWMKANERVHKITIDAYIYRPRARSQNFQQTAPKPTNTTSQHQLFQIKESPYEMDRSDILAKSHGPFYSSRKGDAFQSSQFASKYDLKRDSDEKSTGMPISLYGSTVKKTRKSMSPAKKSTGEDEEQGFFSKLFQGFGCGCVRNNKKQTVSYSK